MPPHISFIHSILLHHTSQECW
uniref:Uncharacterized protein n=1 Tax=Wuchereria bancrofti TaxID=6293 RepID=A0A1I8EA25_WUCBA